MPATELQEVHVRPFVLFGAAAEVAAFRKAVDRRMAALKLDASAFEPLEPQTGDRERAAGNLNLRTLLEWADSVSLRSPADEQSPAEDALHDANVQLLGRLAATLAARFSEPAAV